VYHEKVRTTRIYVRDCSTVSPFALILFGGALGAERSRKGTQGDALLTVDSWIKFSVPRHAVAPQDRVPRRRRLRRRTPHAGRRGQPARQRGRRRALTGGVASVIYL